MRALDLDALLRQPSGRLEMVARSAHPRCRARLLDEALARMHGARRHDLGEVERFAEAARRLADPGDDEAAAIRARLELANVARCRDRLEVAHRRLVAVEPLVRTSGGPGERLDLLRYRAAVAIDAGRPAAALPDLAAALEHASPVSSARVWTQIAIAYGDAGGWAEGRAAGRIAMELAEEADDQVLALCATHNLAANLCDSGQPDLALPVLEGLRPLYRGVGTKGDRLRARWVWARALTAAGSAAQGLEQLETLAAVALADAAVPPRLALQIGLDAVAAARRHRRRAEADGLLGDVLRAASARVFSPRLAELVESARRSDRERQTEALERLWRAAGGAAREEPTVRWATRAA